MQSDWIWVCLTALWQRWFPDQPGFELLDDKIEAGYELQGPGRDAAACRIWLEAWRDVLGLLDKGGLTSIHAFDERFRGSQSLFNWIQDLEDALRNAGLKDRQFLTARIAVCEEGLRRFPAEDELMTENRRPWPSRISSWARRLKPGRCTANGCRPIRAGDGADRVVGWLRIHAHSATGLATSRTDSTRRAGRRPSQGSPRSARTAGRCLRRAGTQRRGGRTS
jgi:hypothetical protein